MTDISARKCRKKYPMTNREFFTAVATCNSIDPEIAAKANELIAQLDARNAKRKENHQPTKSQIEAAGRRDAVLAVVTSEPMTREQIAELANVTPAQAVSALSYLARDGKVVVEKAKIDKATKSVYHIA